jgi:hypothetical protein
MKREGFEQQRKKIKSSDDVVHHTVVQEKKTKRRAGETQRDALSRHIVTNDVSCYLHFISCCVAFNNNQLKSHFLF